LSGLDRFRFSETLAAREIFRHYTEEELTQVLAYARGQEHLPTLEPRNDRALAPYRSVPMRELPRLCRTTTSGEASYALRASRTPMSLHRLNVKLLQRADTVQKAS